MRQVPTVSIENIKIKGSLYTSREENTIEQFSQSQKKAVEKYLDLDTLNRKIK